MGLSDRDREEFFGILAEKGIVTKSRHGEWVHTCCENNAEGMLEKIEKLKAGKHCVWIVGYPLTGTHVVQEILRNMDCNMTVDVKNIDPNPIENQGTGTAAIAVLETVTAKAKEEPYAMPQTHVPLKSFPKDIGKNKVIFVDRDPRAVAVANYHFFCKKDSEVFIPPFVNLFNISDVNKFAEVFFEGSHIYGDYFNYCDEWKQNFKKHHPDADILYLNYEYMQSNPVQAVKTIAEFLNVDEDDPEGNASESGLRPKRRRTHKKVKEGEFNINILPREQKKKKSQTAEEKGDNWAEELDPAVANKYALRASLHGYSFNEIQMTSDILSLLKGL